MPQQKEVTAEEFDIISANLGIEAGRFIRSNLGRYVNDRIEMMIEDSQKARMEANPSDVEANTAAMIEYKVAMGIKQFFDEVSHSGEMAAHRLDGTDIDDS